MDEKMVAEIEARQHEDADVLPLCAALRSAWAERDTYVRAANYWKTRQEDAQARAEKAEAHLASRIESDMETQRGENLAGFAEIEHLQARASKYRDLLQRCMNFLVSYSTGKGFDACASELPVAVEEVCKRVLATERDCDSWKQRAEESEKNLGAMTTLKDMHESEHQCCHEAADRLEKDRDSVLALVEEMRAVLFEIATSNGEQAWNLRNIEIAKAALSLPAPAALEALKARIEDPWKEANEVILNSHYRSKAQAVSVVWEEAAKRTKLEAGCLLGTKFEPLLRILVADFFAAAQAARVEAREPSALARLTARIEAATWRKAAAVVREWSGFIDLKAFQAEFLRRAQASEAESRANAEEKP